MIASAVSVNGSSRKSSAAKGKRRSRRAVAPAVRRGSRDPAEGTTEGLRVTPCGETCGQEACGVRSPAHNAGTRAQCERAVAIRFVH